MLSQLQEWEPLADRRRTARLVMFYKIHNDLAAIPMPLLLKSHPLPTRAENSQAYHIPNILSRLPSALILSTNIARLECSS